jgi:hypothetical protein
MQWVDWQHFENFDKPEVEEVLEIVEKFQMKDLMGYKYDWNALHSFMPASSLTLRQITLTG